MAEAECNDDKIMAQIVGHYCALSPENLTCDGMLSLSQTRGRQRRINRDLNSCFAALGRRVTENEAFRWSEEQYKLEQARKAEQPAVDDEPINLDDYLRPFHEWGDE
jgi:hypothetical protein